MLHLLPYLLDIEIPFFKKRKRKEKKAKSEENATGLKSSAEEIEKYKTKLALYRAIIERYREEIEMHENKTLAELKTLIDSESQGVKQIKELILADFHPYIYEKDFLSAAEHAYQFVKDEISPETLPLDFWLTLDDIFNLKAGDDVDKARFLCSLLIALNNSNSKVIVETNGKAFVSFDFNDIYYVIEISTNERFFGPREEVLSKLKDKYKLSYEFNNSEYEEF
ncbi:hypothetical protein HY570_04095 [Candidatus Micrarchaeota archaeon]|nr:hypothetical protein [Candidatus Micrarchaeota archaeon]